MTYTWQKNGASALSQALRFWLEYLLLCRHIPFASSRSFSRRARQRRISFADSHAATVQLMVIRIPADRQALYKPLLEIILVCGQHRLQGIVQKLQVLFQFGGVTFGDGNKSLFLYGVIYNVPELLYEIVLISYKSLPTALLPTPQTDLRSLHRAANYPRPGTPCNNGTGSQRRFSRLVPVRFSSGSHHFSGAHPLAQPR